MESHLLFTDIGLQALTLLFFPARIKINMINIATLDLVSTKTILRI